MWSPSSTLTWLECPLKWSRRRAGEPEAQGRWHPAMLVGTALHAGWARYLDPTQPEESLVRAQAALSRALVEEWPTVLGYSSDGWEMEAVEAVALKCLERVAVKFLPDLLADAGKVVAVECTLGEGDRNRGEYPGTADLITEHGPVDARYLVVTDYKTHWTVGEGAASRYQTQTERSWQLTQYAYFAQKMYSLPVRYIRSLHVAVSPTPKAWPYACPVTQERLDTWRGYADSIWARMDAQSGNEDVSTTPWPNWDSCEKYGAAYRCGYYERCHGGTT